MKAVLVDLSKLAVCGAITELKNIGFLDFPTAVPWVTFKFGKRYTFCRGTKRLPWALSIYVSVRKVESSAVRTPCAYDGELCGIVDPVKGNEWLMDLLVTFTLRSPPTR